MDANQSAYDLTRPYTGRSSFWNQGCPPGTFCEWVPLSTPGAADVGNTDYGVVCRTVASVTPDALVADAGWAWGTDVAAQSMDAYNAAVSEGASWPWWVWAAVAVGLITLYGHSLHAPGWLGHRRGELL